MLGLLKHSLDNLDTLVYRILEFTFDELVRKDYKLCVVFFPEINRLMDQ